MIAAGGALDKRSQQSEQQPFKAAGRGLRGHVKAQYTTVSRVPRHTRSREM